MNNRRRFLYQSAIITAGLLPATRSFAKILAPVNLRLKGSSPGGPEPIPTGVLAQACASLNKGQSIDFASGAQSSFSEATLAWQTAFYHDSLHGLIHLMGKPANADSSWAHQIYNMADNRWTVIDDGMWKNPGHIYGNMTMDFTNGDVFQARGGADYPGNWDQARRAAWWKFGTKTWGYTTTDIRVGGMESHANGLAWHPNLYGKGDGGLVWDTQQFVGFWRKSNGAVQNVFHDFFGEKEGVGEYWPAKDQVIIGGSDGGQLALVSPNNGGTPIVTPVGVPPIRTAGNSDSGNGGFGSLHLHPADPSRIIIVERGGARRVFASSDARNWTMIANHPFTQFPYVVCSLRGGLGALWVIGRVGNTQISKLWKLPV